MKRYVWLLVFLIGGFWGCALPVRTQGIAGPVTWTATAFDLHSGSTLAGAADRFSFTFVLHETQGLELTFTTITWEVWQNGVDLSNRQTRSGSWSLPANGMLWQPFVYRIFCPPADDCPDIGPTTQWDITLEGTDAQGRAVHFAMQPELPWIPPRSANAPPVLTQAPSVELPPIDFTVPRLYFPRIESN
ncbi:MAG: hypothetical protein ETSY2_22805 [Candidatus Entotheonella gemina]|uniref:Uncharacterized protein n=1 Tax=Candidatus Entotheonella gemina TaxID=1429439 RepID=W4M5K9_9BACT|nr:MAG: hypothetical protein ETSY2_22805 [Candidatus Entotheonella gemina]